MKVEEVYMREMAKKIRWMHAAEILGVTDRTMGRWKRSHEEYGYVIDRQWGKASEKRVAVDIIEKVLGIGTNTLISASRNFTKSCGLSMTSSSAARG